MTWIVTATESTRSAVRKLKRNKSWRTRREDRYLNRDRGVDQIEAEQKKEFEKILRLPITW